MPSAKFHYLFLFLLFSVGAQAAQLSIASATAVAGQEEVVVSIEVSDVPGLTSADLEIRYAADILVALELRSSAISANWLIVPNLQTPGTIRLAMAGTEASEIGTGVLLELRFSVLAEAPIGADTPIEFVRAVLGDENLISAEVTDWLDGVVSIVASNDGSVVVEVVEVIIEPVDSVDVNPIDIEIVGKAQLTIASVIGLPGQQDLGVPIKISDAPGLGTAELEITYDAALLTALEPQAGSLVAGWRIVADLDPSGVIHIFMTGGDGAADATTDGTNSTNETDTLVDGAGTLLELRFALALAAEPGGVAVINFSNVTLSSNTPSSFGTSSAIGVGGLFGGGVTVAKTADFDRNGVVGLGDFLALAEVFGQGAFGGEFLASFDLDESQLIDSGDLFIWADNLNRGADEIIIPAAGDVGPGGNAAARVLLSGPADALAAVGPGQVIALEISAENLQGLSRASVVLEASPPEAFSLADTRFDLSRSGLNESLLSQDKTTGRIEIGIVRLDESAQLNEPVNGAVHLGTLSLITTADFSTITQASVRLVGASLGTSYSARDGFVEADLNQRVVLNANTPPELIPNNAIADLTLTQGQDSYNRDLDAAPQVFTDLNGDPLSYTVSSSNPNSVRVSLFADLLNVEALGPGRSIVTVSAQDGRPCLDTPATNTVGEDGDVLVEAACFAQDSFEVTVQQEVPFTIPHLRAGQLPSVDANLDEWEDTFAQPLLIGAHFSSTTGQVLGPVEAADQDVAVWLGWNDETNLLYIAARVRDDAYGTTSRIGAEDVWRSDDIEVYLDADNSGGFYFAEDLQAQQYVLNPAGLWNAVLFPLALATDVAAVSEPPFVEAAVRREGTTYFYELALPGWDGLSFTGERLRHLFIGDEVIGLTFFFADFESEAAADAGQHHAHNGLNGPRQAWRDTDQFTDFRLGSPSNQAPVAGPPEALVLDTGGATFALELAGEAPVFIDPEGDALSFSATSTDPKIARAQISGTILSIIPLAAGQSQIVVVASDGLGGQAEVVIPVTVLTPLAVAQNSPRSFSGVRPGQEIPLVLTGTGLQDVRQLEFYLALSPLGLLAEKSGTGLSGEAGLGTLFFSMVETLEAELEAQIKLTEVVLGSAAGQRSVLGTDQLDVQVELTSFANSPPTAAEPFLEDLVLVIGFSFLSLDLEEDSPAFTDADGDALSYRVVSSNPAAVEAELRGSVLSIAALNSGISLITLTADDGKDETSVSFSVRANTRPEVANPIGPILLNVGDPTFERKLNDEPPVFVDADGDELVYMLNEGGDNRPVEVRLEGDLLTATAVRPGTVQSRILADDGESANTAVIEFVVNAPPEVVAAIPPITLWEGGAPFELDLNAEPAVFTDADGDVLSYELLIDRPSDDATSQTGDQPSDLAAQPLLVDSRLTVTPLTPGRFTFALVANDGRGRTTALPVQVEVLERSVLDLDGDGTVDLDDLLVLLEHFGQHQGDDGFDAALDVDGDLTIGFFDFFVFAQNLGRKADEVEIPNPDTGDPGPFENVDARFSLVSPTTLTEIGPGEDVELELVGEGLKNVSQFEVLFHLQPAAAFDLEAAVFVTDSRFITPNKVLLIGEDVLAVGGVAIGSPDVEIDASSVLDGLGGGNPFNVDLGDVVSVDLGVDGRATLGTLKLPTAPAFSAQTPAQITVLAVEVGPSLGRRDIFNHESDFDLTVDLNTNTPPLLANPIGDQALQLNEEFRHDLALEPAVFTDADADLLSYTVSASAAGIVQVELGPADDAPGLLIITPISDGRVTITLQADDGRGGLTENQFEVAVRSPQLVISTQTLDFGPVLVGQQQRQAVTLSNAGNAQLRITALGGVELPFTVDENEFSLAPLEEQVLEIIFAPTDLGNASDTLVIASNDPQIDRITVVLSGSGTASGALAAEDVDLGDVPLGQSKEVTVVVANNRNIDFSYNELSLSGVGSAFFERLAPNANSGIIVAGEQLAVVLLFTPQEIGAASVTLRLAGADDAIQANLLGRGVQQRIEIAPSEVNFGTVVVGQAATLDFSVANLGNIPLTVNQITAASQHFSVAPVALVVAGGESQTVTVTFAPATLGQHSGVVTLSSDDALNPTLFVQLQGEAVLPALEAPVLLNPAAEAADLSEDLELSWEPTANAQTYEVQLALSPAFTEPLILAEGLVETRYTAQDLAFDTEHFWRVRAQNESGQGPWSIIRRFTTKLKTLPPPQPQADQEKEVIQTLLPFLRWSAVEGADFYQLQVATDANFNTFLLDLDNLVETELSLLRGIEDGGLYFWRVRSGNQDGFSLWSAVQQFEVQLADETAPTNPARVSVWSDADKTAELANSEWYRHDTPHFEWDPAADDQSGVAGYLVGLTTDLNDPLDDRTLQTQTAYTSSSLIAADGLYYLRLRTVDQAGNKSPTLTLFTYGYDATPPIFIATPPQFHADKSDLPLTVELDELSAVQAATLYYRQGGELAYVPVAMESADGSEFTATVPGDQIGILGLQFYFEANDQSGNRALWPFGAPQDSRFNLLVNVEDAIASQALPADAWAMVSVPLEADNGSPLHLLPDLGPYDNTRWRLFRFFDNAYQEFAQTDIGSFVPGRAFWLRSRVGDIRMRSGSGRSTGLDGFFQLNLAPGWNDIATPFSFAVGWDQIMEASGNPDGVSGPYAYENGSWSLPQSDDLLRPWAGYAVQNANSNFVTLLIPPVAAQAVVPGKQTSKQTILSDASEWTLQLSVSRADAADIHNYLGFRTDAQSGRDRWDWPEPPPPPGSQLRLYMPHDEWPRYPGPYTTDFRPIGDGVVWDFAVEGDPGLARLSFNGMDDLPAFMQAKLRIVDGDVALDLQQGLDYAFHLKGVGQAQRFQIVVGGSEYVAAATEEFKPLPKTVALFQSWPNPFNAETLIAYQLPRRAPVRLSVHDLLGRSITVLVDRVQNAGYFSVTWDGRNDQGTKVASGVYLYVLETPAGRETRKMVLVE